MLTDVDRLTVFLDEFDGYDLTLFENKKWKTDGDFALKIIPALKEALKAEDLHAALEKVAEDGGYKKGQVLWVFRIAITGNAVTPGGATEMAKLLGRNKCMERLCESEKRLQAR